MWERIHRLYEVHLARIEIGIVIVLLITVIGLSLLLILSRNFDFQFGDPSILNRLVFVCTFYLCLFGGVLATRTSRHIKIDVIEPYLPSSWSTRLDGFLFLVAGIVSLIIASTATRFILTIIEPGASLIPATDDWYLRERLWKWPIVLVFLLIALHFFVHGTRRIRGIEQHAKDEL